MSTPSEMIINVGFVEELELHISPLVNENRDEEIKF